QAVDLVFRQDDRQQPVLEAVVEEDIGKGRRDERAKAVIEQCPGRVLARASAAEVASREQYLGTLVTRLVQREVRVEPALRVVHTRLAAVEVAPRIEQVGAGAGRVDRLHALLR